MGAAYLEKNLNAVAQEGRIVQIATLTGSSAQINLQKVLLKRLRLQGTTLRSRAIEQKMVLTPKICQANPTVVCRWQAETINRSQF